MECLGSRLRQERKRLRLTQIEFAELGGVAQNAQGHYENGKRVPKADYLQRLSVAGVDIPYVLSGKPETVFGGSDMRKVVPPFLIDERNAGHAVEDVIAQLGQTLWMTAKTIAAVATMASSTEGDGPNLKMEESLKGFQSDSRRFIALACDLGHAVSMRNA